MGVYLVVSTSEKVGLETCEAYAEAESALGRAWSLASTKATDPVWVHSNPPEERMEDGAVRWIFLDTSKNFVCVYYRAIETGLLSKRDPVAALRDMIMPSVQVVSTQVTPTTLLTPTDYKATVVSAPNEKMNMSLPGGWNRDGKTITLRTIVEDPHLVLPFDQLTASQKKALTTARIAKNPGWAMYCEGNIWTRTEALAELKSNASPIVVEAIVDYEIEWLDNLYTESLEDSD